MRTGAEATAAAATEADSGVSSHHRLRFGQAIRVEYSAVRDRVYVRPYEGGALRILDPDVRCSRATAGERRNPARGSRVVVVDAAAMPAVALVLEAGGPRWR